MFTGDINTKIPAFYNAILKQAPNLNTVGTITTGTWNGTTIGINFGGTNATSMATTNGVVKFDGTRLVTSTTDLIDASNRMTNSSQPCFFAFLSANTSLTSTGAAIKVPFNSTSFDNASNFNTGSGFFTAPVTGNYLFNCSISFTLTNPQSNGDIRFNVNGTNVSRFMSGNPSNIAVPGAAFLTYAGSVIYHMTSGQTAAIYFQMNDGAVSVAGGSNLTFFGGYLCC